MKKFRDFVVHLYEDLGYNAPEIYSPETKKQIEQGKQLVPILKNLITATGGQFPFKFEHEGKMHQLSDHGHALLRHLNRDMQLTSKKAMGNAKGGATNRMSAHSVKDDMDTYYLGTAVGELQAWHPELVKNEVVPFLKKYAVAEHSHKDFDMAREEAHHEYTEKNTAEDIAEDRDKFSPIIHDKESGKTYFYHGPLELDKKETGWDQKSN